MWRNQTSSTSWLHALPLERFARALTKHSFNCNTSLFLHFFLFLFLLFFFFLPPSTPAAGYISSSAGAVPRGAASSKISLTAATGCVEVADGARLMSRCLSPRVIYRPLNQPQPSQVSLTFSQNFPLSACLSAQAFLFIAIGVSFDPLL